MLLHHCPIDFIKSISTPNQTPTANSNLHLFTPFLHNILFPAKLLGLVSVTSTSGSHCASYNKMAWLYDLSSCVTATYHMWLVRTYCIWLVSYEWIKNWQRRKNNKMMIVKGTFFCSYLPSYITALRDSNLKMKKAKPPLPQHFFLIALSIINLLNLAQNLELQTISDKQLVQEAGLKHTLRLNY